MADDTMDALVKRQSAFAAPACKVDRDSMRDSYGAYLEARAQHTSPEKATKELVAPIELVVKSQLLKEWICFLVSVLLICIFQDKNKGVSLLVS